MESSTSLYNLHRNGQASEFSSSASQNSPLNGMRKSASQAYFDRYPERRGKAPYIPSPRLATPEVDVLNAASYSEAYNGRRHVDIECTQELKRLDVHAAIESRRESSVDQHFDKQQPIQKGSPSKAADSLNAMATGMSSHVPRVPSSGQHIAKEVPARGKATVQTASRPPLGYPRLPAFFQRSVSQTVSLSGGSFGGGRSPSPVPAMPLYEEGGVKASHSAPNTNINDTARRRLKAQKSMPNVKISIDEKETSDVPEMPPTRPWALPSLYLGRGPKLRGRESPFPQASSSNVSSIDDIIRRNTPDLVLPRSASSKSDVFTQSLGRRTILTKESSALRDDDAESDSSLASIEREIRNSRRMARSSDEVLERTPKFNSSESDKLFPTSSSQAIFRRRNKATPSALNPGRRIRTPSSANTSSPSQIDDSPIVSRRLSKKFANLSTLSGPVPLSPLPSPLAMSSPPTLSLTQDDDIYSYLHSKRLTSLMTLERNPFQGLTVSFADVGDPDGHPVFVFLGLGAVRYLVGLYDEMATLLHLRLICVDRWGLGKSDDLSAERRGVLEWSMVVEELADQLEIDRFSLLAHSAGAPYAMATCLIHESRIAGPVHLLAPWVGSIVESGYKWLRYVPDGVIKTAQAADWRMQAWKLGLGKTHSSEQSSDVRRGASQEENATSREVCNPSTSQKSLDIALSNSNPVRESLKKSTSTMLEVDTSANDSEANDWTIITEPDSPAHNKSYNSSISGRSISPLSGNAFVDVNGFNLQSPLGVSSTSGYRSPKGNLTPAYTGSEFTTALLRASHAETLRGGATSDLLVILERSSQKPWGFSYTDIKHAVIVWQGDKDERISLSSVMWMEREMKSCSVNLVKNANHGLMTNVAVVMEALESISTHR